MPRSVEEWVGRTPDTWPPPPRVRDRILARQDRCCADCARPFSAALKPEFDHDTAIINGGANREANILARCPFCHALKTKKDVATKAKDARVRKKHLGLEVKRSAFATSRGGRYKQKIGGRTILREEE